MIMLSSGIMFLDGSQTFVGVLATIIVMCVLAGENNFIYKILTLIKTQMADNLKNVSSDINFCKLKNDSDYKLLKVLMGDKKRLTNEQRIKGGALLSRISLWKSTFQIEHAKPELSGEDREISLAPLFTFMFVLVVFIYDELLRSALVPFNDFFVSSLSFFTLFSSVYWIVKWITYLVDLYQNNGSRTYNLTSDNRFCTFMQYFHSSLFKKDWLRFFVEIAWFFIIAFFLAVFQIRGWLQISVLTLLGVLLPLIFEGFYHLFSVYNPLFFFR